MTSTKRSILDHVVGTLVPEGGSWTTGAFHLEHFDLVLRKTEFIARPHPGFTIGPDEGLELLGVEVAPVLAAIGAEIGRPVTFDSSNAVYVRRPGASEVEALVGTTFTSTFSILGSQPEFAARVNWALQDARYRDFLSFFAEARSARNPRPLGYNLLERVAITLTPRRGNLAIERIPAAMTRLGLTDQDLPQLRGRQDLYVGDRHAYHLSDTRPALPHKERDEAVAEMRLVISRYEEVLAGKR